MRRGILVLLVSLAPLSAEAQTILDIDFTQNYLLKTVPLGFGGAYRALADSNSAILINPAGITQNKGQSVVSGDYMHNKRAGSNAFSVSAVDAKTLDFLALGIEYDRDAFTVNKGVVVNQVTVAAAYAYEEIVSVGANVKGYVSTVNDPFTTGPKGADMDLGLLVKPISILSMALTVQNLFQGNRRPPFPFVLGFGAGLNLKPHARLAVDLTRDFQTPSVAKVNSYFGAELRLVEGVYARGGFGLDRVRDDNFWSGGLALNGPKISLNFTFSQRLNPAAETFAGNVEFMF
ncbi:MAG: hypothetical protein V1798_00875 [Pseudomonadota bacterium]